MSLLNHKLQHYQLILASQSPRRRELLQKLDIPFVVKTIPGIDENYPTSLWAYDVPVYLAQKKAKAYAHILNPSNIVLTADTIVWGNGRVLNKPQNINEARSMLRDLSGAVHEVITGACLSAPNLQQPFSTTTKVWFNELTQAEIDYYLDKYKPLDKAGAYGIQEWIGFMGIAKIEGCYNNVVGLPVSQVYHQLMSFLDRLAVQHQS